MKIYMVSLLHRATITVLLVLILDAVRVHFVFVCSGLYGIEAYLEVKTVIFIFSEIHVIIITSCVCFLSYCPVCLDRSIF